MALRDAIIKLGDEHPEMLRDLIPVLAKATGAHCCRKATPAPESEVRADLIRLAYDHPEWRPLLLPIIPRDTDAPAPTRGTRASRRR